MADRLLDDHQAGDALIWKAIQAGNTKQALRLVDKKLVKKRTAHLTVRVNGEKKNNFRQDHVMDKLKYLSFT